MVADRGYAAENVNITFDKFKEDFGDKPMFVQ